MKRHYLFLISAATIILILSEKLVAQKVVPAANGSPVVISKNGKYTICVDGFLNEADAKNYAASISKTRSKRVVKTDVSRGNVVSGEKKTSAVEKDNLGKVIKYGPWRMLNNFKILSYNFDDFYKAAAIEREKVGSGSGNRKIVVKKVMPDQASLLKLSQNAQISVVLGQQYSIQVGHFTFDKNAVAALQKISAMTTMPVLVIIKNGYYSILIEGFSNWNDARLFVFQLGKMGFNGTIVKVNYPVRVSPTTS